jgi:hypothetical protein
MSSGIVWGEYDDTTAFTRLGYAQVTGGLPGFIEFFADRFLKRGRWDYAADLVCEKFKPRPVARAWKLNELEPIRIEGWLHQFHPAWQWPEQRSLTSDGVKASEKILHAKGLWLTGSDVGAEDANDVNAAQLHLLAYLRNIGHAPTINAYLL